MRKAKWKKKKKLENIKLRFEYKLERYKVIKDEE